TDGVIETQNSDKGIYGRKRLLSLIEAIYAEGYDQEPPLDSVVEQIVREVAGYRDGTEYADDLTLLAIKRK
ncbi:MAG: SpoIIE family protein phosphatase, partial [bacterium]